MLHNFKNKLYSSHILEDGSIDNLSDAFIKSNYAEIATLLVQGAFSFYLPKHEMEF